MANKPINMQYLFKVEDLPQRLYSGDGQHHRVVMIDRDIDLAMILNDKTGTTQWVSMRNLEDI